MSPKISVCMAVYNARAYLKKAMESILRQTFTDFEFLIIDDGSTDNSLAILQSYAMRDKRIRLSSRPNRGIAKTRNELLSQAQGEFIAIMDADDVALPERFALQVAFLNLHPSVVCVGGSQDFIDETGRFLYTFRPPQHNSEIQALALQGHTPINHPSAMIRRDAFVKVGGYNEHFKATVGDLDLFLRLGEVGELANLPDSVLQYRQHRNSISEAKQLQQIEDKRAACEQAWQRRGIKGVFTATEPWRPTDRPSRYHYILRFGWQFFSQGRREDAIAYGIKSVATMPFAAEGWRLLACALMKPLPEGEAP